MKNRLILSGILIFAFSFNVSAQPENIKGLIEKIKRGEIAPPDNIPPEIRSEMTSPEMPQAQVPQGTAPQAASPEVQSPVEAGREQPVIPEESDAQTKAPPGTISLDIKGMDVLDVLKLLARQANLNIVAGKNVTGRVTMFLKNVEPLDAFEMIIASNDLAYFKKNDIINVITDRDYEVTFGEKFNEKRQLKSIKLEYANPAAVNQALSQLKTNIGRIIVDESTGRVILFDTPERVAEMEQLLKGLDSPLETRVYELNYAVAEDLTKKVEEVVTKGVGYVKFDPRTNKIVVTDYPQKLDKIAKILTAFDEKTMQVLIDAQIFEIKPSEDFAMGIDWDYFLKHNLRTEGDFKVATGTGDKLIVGTSTVNEIGEYRAVLDLLQTLGEARVLSSPRITAINNQEAKILVGKKDAYITSSVSQQNGTAVTADSVNYVDVGVKLYVTPTINRDGFVTMKIKPEISSAERVSIQSGGQAFDIPIVTTSQAETSVMVKDGATIIIAGLKKEDKNKTVKKLPLLGDIPLVGHFFRSTSTSIDKTELVIFLSPKIIGGDVPVPYKSLTNDKELLGVQASVQADYERTIVTPSFKSAGEYSAFIAQKIQAIADGLIKNTVGSGKIKLSLSVLKTGALKTKPRIVASTNPSFNKAVLQSVSMALPFPALPAQFTKQSEDFTIVLSLKGYPEPSIPARSAPEAAEQNPYDPLEKKIKEIERQLDSMEQ